MALGSGIAERSRKNDLKTRISLEILHQGGVMKDVDNFQKAYKYEKLAEIQAYYSNLMKKRGDGIMGNVKKMTDVEIVRTLSRLWAVRASRQDLWQVFKSKREAIEYCEECEVTYTVRDF